MNPEIQFATIIGGARSGKTILATATALQIIIETRTFTYMRGRTFTNDLVIVDKAQEITPHIAKLMFARAGHDSKFIFLGYPSDNQIDSHYVDSKSNGLVYTFDKM